MGRDIIVTLPRNQGGLFHLYEKAEAPSYWRCKRKPKDLTEKDRVFICCEGVIHGYFEIEEIYFESDPDYTEDYKHWIIQFKDDSFTEIIPIPMRGFQAFRYRKFDYEEI